MRPKTSRLVNRQPVRSPSPDIANRSIIRETIAPINEILIKSRANSYGPVGWGDSSAEQWQKQAMNWEEKYRMLEEQLNKLLVENSALKRDVYGLHEALSKKQDELASKKDESSSSADISEYQRRFGQLMEEIHRIQLLLQQQKERNGVLQHENEKLRLNPMRNARNTQSIYPQNDTEKKLSEIEQILNDQMNKMKSEMDLKVRLLLNGLEDRLMEIRRHQLQLESMIRKAEFATPAKSEKGPRYYDSTEAGHSRSPSDPNKFQRKSVPFDSEKKDLQHMLRQMEVDNKNMEDELRQIDAYKNNLEEKLNETQNLVEVLTSQLKQNEKKLKEDGEKQCPKCKLLLIQIGQIEIQMEKLKKAKNEGQNSQMTLKNDLERQHEIFSYNLEDYIKRIKNIKVSLSNEDFKQFINKINELISQNSSLNGKISDLLDQINQTKKQAKTKDIEQTILINTLKRQNDVLNFQLKEQDNQILKLQDLIQDRLTQERPKVEVVDSIPVQRQMDPNIFQRYIEEAIKKLQNLQESMETTLHE